MYDKLDRMYWTYVLELEKESYYIGKSKKESISSRLKDHFSNKGSIATRKRNPQKVIEIEKYDCEKALTRKYINKYGKNRVKGYAWCQTTDW
tara:strand:+ start:2524 stop:2799 length:276 start_codon:yes stop_codon:yes gene_type:complete